MFAVVFEVHPHKEKKDEYLDFAQHLKPMLEETDGFLSVERFESRGRPGWMLSLSLWRDEKSVVRWRSQGEHHAIQLQGRASTFSDYQLRVGEVTWDSGRPGLIEQRLDETEIGAAKALGLTAIAPRDGTRAFEDLEGLLANIGLDLHDEALVGRDLFESIYNPGNLLLLTAWKTAADLERWRPKGINDHRRMRCVRDYGLFDRREAPQFCPIIHRK